MLENNQLLNVTEFAEKPNLEYAGANLRVPGLPEGEYLTVFGQYVIKPQIFTYLEEHIGNNVRERGEFQLTSALDRLRQEERLPRPHRGRPPLRHRPPRALPRDAADLPGGLIVGGRRLLVVPAAAIEAAARRRVAARGRVKAG